MSSDANKSNDEINISFSVSRSFISMQVAIILGCLALWVFSGSQAIRSIIILSLSLDVIAVIFYYITKGKDIGEGSDSDDTSVERETMDVEVEHASSNREAVKETQGTIRNRVPIPKPTEVGNEGFAGPDPIIEQQEPTEVKPELEPELVNLNNVMSDDWSEFY